MRIAPAAVAVAAHVPTGTRRRICALRDHVRGRRRKTAIAPEERSHLHVAFSVHSRLCRNRSLFSDGRVGIHHRGVSRRAVACSRVRRCNMVVKVQVIVWPDATAVPSTGSADSAVAMTSFPASRLFANAHARLIGCRRVCRDPEGKRNGMSPSKQLQLCERMREL